VNKLIVPMIVAGVVLAVVAIVALEEDSSPRDHMTGQSEFDIPVQDPALVAEGDVLYRASCAACHGSDLRGTEFGPSQLSVVYQPGHHSDESYMSAVFNGVPAHHWDFGDMAPVSGLTQDDMDRIIAFVRENQRIEGFEPYPPS
jgi:mono/diheme cytochrome c family protein